MSDESVSHWIDQVKSGDSLAAQHLWERYYLQLVKTARNKLAGRASAVSDEEDVAVSVFESFYRAAQTGRFPDLSDRGSLWRLLLKMSARKIVDQRRYDHRQRRGSKETTISIHDPFEADGAMIELIGDEPTPEFVVEMTEACDRLLNHLGDDSLRSIAIRKMEGYSNVEIASELNCSDRTIERRMNLIREKCRQELLGENYDESQ